MESSIPEVGGWLSRRRLDAVFAFPGEQADPWILAAEAAGSRVICAASETAAGYMATGLARLSGSPAAVIVGGGPALAMLVPSIQSAVTERVPVMAMVGQSDGTGFPQTDHFGTRDHALLDAVFAGAVVHAADYGTVDEALTRAQRFLDEGRPAAVTVPVPRTTFTPAGGPAAPTPTFAPTTAVHPSAPITGLVSYLSVVRAAATAAAGRAPLFVDSGQARHAARRQLPVGSFFDAPLTAPMGSGMCAAIGTAIAQQRRTFAVVGDGSALMFLGELETAARHRADVTIVVCLNGVLGSPYARTSPHGSASSRLGPIDWPALAGAFGIEWKAACDDATLRATLTSTTEGPRLVYVPTPKVDVSLTSPLPVHRRSES